MSRALDTALFVGALLLLWQGLYWLAGEVALASPLTTAGRALELLADTGFWPHAAETGIAFGYALVYAILGGFGLGLLLGLHRLSGAVAEPILVSLYSLPKVTLYPLMLLVFGLGLSAKVAFGVIHGIIPMTLFTMNAVRTVAPVYFKAARVMQVGRGGMIVHIILPAAFPEIVSGVRVGFSLTLLGVLIGEMFASQRGLGHLVIRAIGRHDVPTMMAVTLLLVVVAVILNSGLLALDRRLHRRV